MASITKTTTSKGEVRYRVRHRDPRGKSKEKWFTRKIDAERYGRNIETDIDRGQFVDPKHGQIRLNDWCATWVAGRSHLRGSSADRDSSYIANHILPVFGERRLSDLRHSEFDLWIGRMVKQGLAPATVRKAAQLVSAMLEAAVQDGLIAFNPAKGASLPKLLPSEMRFLNSEEVWSLADAIHEKYRAFVVTGAFTGLRPGELRGLRVENLDLLRRRVTVVSTAIERNGKIELGPPKTAASRRTLALPSFLVDEIAIHLNRFPPGSDGFVFAAPRGGPVRKDNFRRRVWMPAVGASVGQPMRQHDLRHTHAALLIEQGEHPKVIQERLGHRSISTTLDRYGHLFDGLDEAAAESLDKAYGQRAVGFSWG